MLNWCSADDWSLRVQHCSFQTEKHKRGRQEKLGFFQHIKNLLKGKRMRIFRVFNEGGQRCWNSTYSGGKFPFACCYKVEPGVLIKNQTGLKSI